MPRPKGSKNKPKVKFGVPYPKVAHVADVKFKPPNDVDKYELKRLYWYLLAIEKKIMVDPTSVSPDNYARALRAYTDSVKAYKEREKEVRAKTRVDKIRSNQGSTEQDNTPTVSRNGQADMGARVPTVNPIT